MSVHGTETGMETELLDCTWCGSARSIEHRICQVCLMEYPLETEVIQLPDRNERAPKRVIALDPIELPVAEER